MAKRRKMLPAHRRNTVDESLLIRSAESLGRVIGSLQRQLDAARRLVGPVAVDERKNGHAPPRQRSEGSAKRAAKAKVAANNKTTTAGRKRSATSTRAAKKR